MPIDPLPGAETLARWWDDTGAGIATRCVSSSEIEQFERRVAVKLPAAFRYYLSIASPVGDPSWDNELTNWWPFESLGTVADGYEYELAARIAAYRGQLVLFADHMTWAWAWAINCAPGPDNGKVAVIGGGESDRFVSDGFESFVTKYVADDPSLWP